MKTTIFLFGFLVLAFVLLKWASQISRGEFAEYPLLQSLDINKKREISRFYARTLRVMAAILSAVPVAYFLPVRWHFVAEIFFYTAIPVAAACWFLLGPYLYREKPGKGGAKEP